MKQFGRRFLISMLCAGILLGIAAFGAVLRTELPFSALLATKAEAAGGSCGENAVWAYDTETKTLTVSGKGEMADYSTKTTNGITFTTAPWNSYFASIRSVVIDSGVTSVGGYAFYGCTGINRIRLSESVLSIRDFAFSDCAGLTEIRVDAANPVYHSAGNCLIATKDKTLVLGCSASAIPADGSVTRIAGNAFRGCATLIRLTVPDSVTTIDAEAFRGCDQLAELMLPFLGNTADSKGMSGAFGYIFGYSHSYNEGGRLPYYTNMLSDKITEYFSYYVPTSLRKVVITGGSVISDYAFNGCYFLKEILLPKTTEDIGSYAFCGCSGLTSLTLPDGASRIGNVAFAGCTGLKTVHLGNGPASIGNDAFDGCTSLQSIAIPEGVKTIDFFAFADCTALTSIEIPSSLKNVDSQVFYNCKSLKNVYLHDLSAWCSISFDAKSATSNPLYYASHLFLNGTEIRDLVIPNDVSRINKGSFMNCRSMKSITVPDSVRSIGEGAFGGCEGLTEITLPFIGACRNYDVEVEIEGALSAVFGHIFGYSKDTGIYQDTHWLGYYARIPTTLRKVTITQETVIPENAFCNCYFLTEIHLPQNVQRIGYHAFYNTGVSNNTSNWYNHALYIDHCLIQADTDYSGVFTIRNGTTCIADYAFIGCEKLTDITTAPGVAIIGPWTFGNCGTLNSLSIPVTVKSILSRAFSGTFVKHIYYQGSKEQWVQVAISDNQFSGALDYAIYNASSDSQYTAWIHFGQTVYALSYDANGGSGAPAVQTGSGVVTLSGTRPTRSGYIFLGWATTAEATSAQYQPGGSFELTENTTLFAVWRGSDVEIDPTQNHLIWLQNYQTSRTIDYHSTLILTAITKEAVDPHNIHWLINGKDIGVGNRLTLQGVKNSFSVQLQLYDANGTLLDESEIEMIQVKTDFFSKLIAFFRQLFGALPKITQAWRG